MSARTRGSSKCIWGAEHAGSRKRRSALRRRDRAAAGVASPRRSARSPACWAATASARPSLLRAIAGAHPISARHRSSGKAQDISRLPMYERAQARHRLGAAGPRHVSAADGAGKPGDRLRRAAARRAQGAGRDLRPVPDPEDHAAAGAAATCRAASSSNSSIARALVMKPRLLVLDEPTEGIQPSIIKDIGRVIALLRSRGDMAILLVEQYFDFAQELAQTHGGDGSRRRRAVRPAGGARRSGCTTAPLCLIRPAATCERRTACCRPAVAGDATVLDDLRQAGCLKARFPRRDRSGLDGCRDAEHRRRRRRRRPAGHRRSRSAPARRLTIAAQAAERFYRALPGDCAVARADAR